MHYIQKYILDKLVFSEVLRNRDMRPPHTESNLYQYHLKRLVDAEYIVKLPTGYTLSTKGLRYADKHSGDLKTQRPQPKLVTILRLENNTGDVLLVPRLKQPFIDKYTLPSGKIHENETLLEAGRREVIEKVGISDKIELLQLGAVHLVIANGAEIISELYGFILRGILPASCEVAGKFWSSSEEHTTALMPGTYQLMKVVEGFQEIKINLHDTK